jgi:hypothetical protein
MSRFKPRAPKWPWRDFLTAAEANTLARADSAKAEWKRLNAERAGITNRAIQRAKAAGARKVEPSHG